MANLQYIGARYVPKFYLNPDDSSNDWKSGVLYEALTIVTYNNDSYTSKKTVPASVGNPADNSQYWACTTKYTAALVALQNTVAVLEDDIDEIKNTFVTPEMFGAVGNGLADDYDALYEALENYNCVVFGAGKTYAISRPLHITHGNLFIFGNGATIKLDNSVQNVLAAVQIGVNDQTLKNLYLDDLVIDANKNRGNIDVASAGVMSRYNSTLYISNFDNVHIDSCTFKNIGVWGIFHGNSVGLPLCEGFYLSNSIFESVIGTTSEAFVDSSCIYCQAEKVYIENNRFVGTVDNNTAIELHNNADHHIANNYIEKYRAGILLINETNTGEQSGFVENNTLFDVEVGVYLWQDNGLKNVTIANNSIIYNAYFQNVNSTLSGGVVTHRNNDGSEDMKNIRVIGNYIKQLASITSSTAGYLLNICGVLLHGLNTDYYNIDVLDNMIENTSGYGIAVSSAVGGKNVSVKGNTIINACNNGEITSGTGYPYAAIRIGGANGVIATNNTILSNIAMGRDVFTPSDSNIYVDNSFIDNGTLVGFESANIVQINADSSGIAGGFAHNEDSRIEFKYDRIYYDSNIEITEATPAGYALYVILPFTPTRSQSLPVIITGYDGDVVCAYLEIVSGSATAYFRRTPQNCLGNKLVTGSRIIIHGVIYR